MPDLHAYIEAERQDIETRQRHVLATGSIDNQADVRIFARLEGRLEQLAAIEAWLAGNTCEPVVRIADGQGVAELKV